ncbi:HEAT repeat domain-containing protein [Oscillatoria sp. HE19RPO]|uniref:HEAT repeat domain-containing protein n=1 Tax=Oscillatoria sp. HE19RPO TaxID=2954806 RepID=UPI0020C4FE4B|nr:HEAT repeat domain-containing protein [Oscillatoria sp. HE19RPO]
MTSRVETRHVSALLGGWVPGARVVVTCRVNVWDADKNAFSGFDVFRNLEFNPEQVTNYIRRWFAAMGDVATGESLEAKLAQSNNSRIKELIHNPLRLWMLCQIWRTGGGFLPETQAGLYEQFVKWVYRWKADEEILDQREAIDKALAQLAWAAMEQKDEVSRLRLPESWVLKVLGSRQIFKAVEKLGWLNRLERSPEAIWVFYHATFQEYFAALAVENWNDFLPKTHVNRPVEGKYRIFEPQWKQVILLWLGREYVKDKEEFLQKLVKFQDGVPDFYAYQAYFLAAAGINEFKACSRAAEIVRQVVKLGFGEFDIPKQKWRTFLDPIEKGARKVIPETIRRLAIRELSEISKNCPDEYTHWQLVESLGKIGVANPEAIARLLAVICTTENEDTRRWAAKSLGEIGVANPDAIAGLVELIYRTKDESTCRRAAQSLGEIGVANSDAIAALLELIPTGEDEFTRWQLIESLGKIGVANPEAITGVVQLIRRSKDEFTRMLAAKILGKIGVANPEARAALLELIHERENESTRRQAARSLEQIGVRNPKVIVGSHEVIRTTLLATESLVEPIDPRNPEAIAGLLELIRTTENESTRRQAARSLGEIGVGNAQAIAGLLKVMRTTEHEGTRKRAAESLPKILTTPEHYAWVVSALKDCLSNEVYQNNFKRFHECYKVIWNCAENLPYPQFYEAWDNPLTTPYPEVIEQTQVGHNSTVDSLETQPIDICLQLQNLPIFCLDATILTDETEPSEIAQTLCQLIWEKAFPDEDYPKEVTTASKLREQLKTLKLRQNLPKLPILITHCHPSTELIVFCRKLTNIVAIAWLTDEPLEAPLKVFPPNQPHLISAIQTWLEEI